MPMTWNLKLTHVSQRAFGIETRFHMSGDVIRIRQADCRNRVGCLENGRKGHLLCQLIRGRKAIDLVSTDVAKRYVGPGRELRIWPLGCHPSTDRPALRDVEHSVGF